MNEEIIEQLLLNERLMNLYTSDTQKKPLKKGEPTGEYRTWFKQRFSR